MPTRKSAADQISKIAREKLGFESLRPGQKEAVTALLDNHDVLVVQPTGSGKSAIYQIAGLLMDGATLIVSPLIALQKDQVDAIAEQNSADAVTLNSTQRISEIRDSLGEIERGSIEYIFLAPEQLSKPETIEKLKNANISLFVVDEAHCISDWGHDFRPDYLRLGDTLQALDHPRVLAMTATATDRVRNEIIQRLHMRRPKVFVQGFDRPNIYLRVDHFKTETEKRNALVHRTRWAAKPGIIYTATRKAAEEIMEALAGEQIEALFYHGGMKAKDRHEIQEKFMSGGAEVIVATNAFGMGVDKPDIRFVYHYDASDSLDSYYQEIGRAGRDGEKSEAVLFFRQQDIGSQSFRTSEGKIDEQQLQQLTARLSEADGPVDPVELGKEIGLSKRKTTAALQRLKDTGAAETLPTGKVRGVSDVDRDEAVTTAAREQEERREAKRERLEKMGGYAQTTNCRREFLLRYLGDDFHGPCNHCDNCEAASGAPHVDPSVGTRREVS